MRYRLALALCFVMPSLARAHFHLDAPPAAYEQSAQGDPQKAFPCGPTPSTAVATDDVTAAIAGSTLSITITETIFHPGHYRVALAPTEADLPAEPPVTPGATACGSVPIDPAPVLPILADGVLEHTSKFAGPQTVDIPLPADSTCGGCVVQVLEFMSSHGAPCFYHHCARVDVLPVGSVLPDAGQPEPPHDSGSGCDAGGGAAGWLAALLACLVTSSRRRTYRARAARS
jgi:hypothetical protein